MFGCAAALAQLQTLARAQAPNSRDTVEHSASFQAVERQAEAKGDLQVGYGLKGRYEVRRYYETEDDLYLLFFTEIEARMTKNLHFYQSYVQIVDSNRSTEGGDYYESFVCTIENDFKEQSDVNYMTRRLD